MHGGGAVLFFVFEVYVYGKRIVLHVWGVGALPGVVALLDLSTWLLQLMLVMLVLDIPVSQLFDYQFVCRLLQIYLFMRHVAVEFLRSRCKRIVLRKVDRRSHTRHTHGFFWAVIV